MVSRDVSFVGNSDGDFLPFRERNGFKRTQYTAFVDSLYRLFHTTYFTDI
jgi:hypothetical protein